MVQFIESQSAVLIIVSLCLSIASIVAAVLVYMRLSRLERPFRDMARIYEEKGAERALEELLKGVDENREFLRGHSEELKRIFRLLGSCYRGMGLVKYNAFEDIGGMQSYSLCLLTEEKQGFIFTNLAGRTSTRGYALDIRDGKPSRKLSDEEKEAFEIAVRFFDSNAG
ncbi:MAG: DUF4446 family protein [Candidatus Krumholzibacteria bacterium]|nr:DUF4446 family protein [Candidatus Krumholzibacteria bacterium]